MARNINQLTPEVEKSFQCCLCRKFLHPEIRMCGNGHNMCEECHLERGSTCPLCHQYVGETSNTQLEALMKQLQVAVPCKNHSAGCIEEIQLDALKLHELECPFREVTCVVLDCRYPIIFNQLESHMVEDHQDLDGGVWVLKKASVIKGGVRIAEILTSKGRRSEPLIDEITSKEIRLQEALEYMIPGTEVMVGKDFFYPDHEISNNSNNCCIGAPPDSQKVDTGRVISRYVDGHVDVTWNDTGKTYRYCMALMEGTT